MILGLGTDFYLLHKDRMLMFLGLLGTFALLILVFAIIHDSADRGRCLRCHFHKIEPLFTGHLKTFLNRYNTDLLSIHADKTN